MYEFEPILARLKEAKQRAGLTNAELAARSGVPIGTVNKILAGNTKEPKLPAFIAIAEALNVSADYLIYGEAAFSEQHVTAPDLELLEKYHQLDERGREAVDETLAREWKASAEPYIQNDAAQIVGSLLANISAKK